MEIEEGEKCVHEQNIYLNVDVSSSTNKDAKRVYLNLDNFQTHNKSGFSSYVYLNTEDESI